MKGLQKKLSFLFFLNLMGCVPTTPVDPSTRNAERSYYNLHLPPKLPSENRRIPGLQSLIVSKDPIPSISLECFTTPMHELFPELMQKAGAAYQMGRVIPTFWVSANLNNLPLEDALKVLFAESDYDVNFFETSKERVWIVQDKHNKKKETNNDDDSFLLGFQHIPASTIISSLIKGPNPGQNYFGNNLNKTTESDVSSLAIIGSSNSIQQLTKALRKADQPPKTVLIKTRKFATESELIQTYFSNPSGGFQANYGEVSNLSLPNSLISGASSASNQQNIFAGSLAGRFAQTVANPLSLSGSINALVQRIKLDYYADTQLSVLSGQTAFLKLGRTGFVLTPQYSNGLVTNVTRTVDATTTLSITPNVLPSGDIRLELSYSSYRLLPNELFQLVGSTRGSSHSSFVQIPPGQPIIIAGRDNQDSTIARNGWPGIRNLPGIGFFFGASSDEFIENLGALVVWAEIIDSDTQAQKSWAEHMPANPVLLPDRFPSTLENARTGWDP